jgi:type VI secretion system secreted protein Hcp
MNPIRTLLIGSLFLTPLCQAQSLDAFMRIDGIPGDSVVRGHENEIVLTSYSQTFATRACSRVVALKNIDRASPALITTAAANTLLPSVVITVRKPGDTPIDFYRALLQNVLIERVEVTGDSGLLKEQLVLKPRQIRIEYRPQARDGSLLPPIVSTMDCH